MSTKRKSQQPRFERGQEDDYDDISGHSGEDSESAGSEPEESSTNQMRSLSFQSLSRAQEDLENTSSDDNSDQEDVGANRKAKGAKHALQKRRNKHAPAEMSAKRPVSVIRDLPGSTSAQTKKTGGTLYQDVRFDPAYGKADLVKARKNYAFLNEYREKELTQMKQMLKETKDEHEKFKLQTAIQSLSSRLKTLKDRDFQAEVMKKVNKKHEGRYLTRAEKRQVILTEKFKTMKKKDIDRAIERKRKKNLAKERKSMPDRRER